MDIRAFKAYDVRGRYGEELTDAVAWATARALVFETGAKSVTIGHDMRTHSPALYRAACAGIQSVGATVQPVGLVSTPMFYRAVIDLKADAGIMVTASHNPPEDNGLKLCGSGARPIAGDSPVSDLGRIAQRVAGSEIMPELSPLTPEPIPVAATYHDFLDTCMANCSTRRFRVVADFANGMGILEGAPLARWLDIIPLYDKLDGTFPNHPANPLDPKNLEDVAAAVRCHDSDFGIAFDGDADRVGFVDETGEIVSMDFITALIARWYLTHQGRGIVPHDLRSSRSAEAYIRQYGGSPLACRVGHSFIKQEMRRVNGLFGGELAGHFYFREAGFVESAALAVLRIATLMSETGSQLSQLARPLRRFANTGEINLPLPDRTVAARAMSDLRESFPDAAASYLDGLLLETPLWWCNVRPSNTEPRLRIVIEARNQQELDRIKPKILHILAPETTIV